MNVPALITALFGRRPAPARIEILAVRPRHTSGRAAPLHAHAATTQRHTASRARPRHHASLNREKTTRA